jgi:hypothetical protein
MVTPLHTALEAEIAAIKTRLIAEAAPLLEPSALEQLSADLALPWQIESGHDPANGLPTYRLWWPAPHSGQRGQVICNSDGSLYAEYDLCIPHPKRHGWFIEAVTAWGRDGAYRSEPRLGATL